MVDGNVERALQAIGLADDEARMYGLLVARGESTVGALAPLAGLSRTKAYTLLDRMVAKGLAERVGDHPRTYMATDPELLLMLRMQDLGSARKLIETELVPLYSRHRGQARQITLLGTAVLRRAEEMLGRAKREIAIVTTFIPKEILHRLTGVMAELRARGVRIRTVVSDALIDAEVLAKLRSLTELRIRSVPNAGLIIVDDEEVLIGSLVDPEEGGSGHLGAGAAPPVLTGLWSQNLELIKLHRLLFEDLYGQEGA